jgi:hypothetical protein
MEAILSLLLGVRVERNTNGLKSFSLDEAVLAVKSTFEAWTSSLLLQTVFRAVDMEICSALTGKSTDPGPMLLNLNRAPCCATPVYEKSRDASRTIATTLAEIKLSGSRLRCISCKRSFVPLFLFLGITRYQNKSQELVKVVFENICDQSYRRGKKQLDQLTGVELSLGKLWRTIMKNSAFNLDLSKKDVKQAHFWSVMDGEIKKKIATDPLHAILADGTCYKLQKAPINMRAEIREFKRNEKLKKDPEAKVSDSKFEMKSRPLQSEVRVIYGLTKSNEVIPLGVYAGKETWRQIGRDLYKRFGRHEQLKREPIAEVLIADGEEALFDGLKQLTKTQQRCQWHFTHEFKGVFQYQDDGNKTERKVYQTEIQMTLDELHAKVLKETNPTEQQKIELEAEIMNAELALKKLAVKLNETNHENAAGYVRNATGSLFTYLRHYLRFGHLGPKVTSQMERFMREIGRRIKKIAWNWSAKGVAILCHIILIRCMNNDLWENYWKKILNLTGNLKLTSEGAFMKKQEHSLLH